MTSRHFSFRIVLLICICFPLILTPAKSADATEANKSIVMRFYAAMNVHDPKAFDKSLAPDWINDPPHPGELVGREGWKPVARGRFTAFPDIHVTVEEMVSDGDKIAARIRMSGTQRGKFMGVPASGKQMNIRVVDFFEIHAGMISKTWHVEDWLTAMKQLGAAQPNQSGKPRRTR